MGSYSPHGSCIDCKFLNNNKCTWFKYFNNEEPKNIPNKIFNKGCNQYCDHPLLLDVLRIFK
jgi:hypothetical protein